ncbi:MAG: tetratricopeptide repeat protein [Lachnospiraceae bacterium]|nr:tetratricopeptide repeat protein [Lachnospiraceae bacterium]
MKKNSGLKKIILIAVLCAVVFAAALFILIRVYQNDRVGDQLSLGEKYLNASDYNAAILAYQQALEIEPANTEAIVGLAEAYNAIGDSDFALELLNQLGGESSDPAVQEMEATIQEERGNLEEAIRIIDKLIEMTDEDEYYDKREELITRLLTGGHIYGNSGGHEAVISAGLMTRGLNVTGQLGTAQGINQSDYVQSQFKDAGFAGKAVKVYCFAQNTYVIDDAGNLWVAGTNRSGQEAMGSSTAVTESGWRQVAGITNVAQVAGGSGYLVVLKNDGTLWYAGQNFGHTGGNQIWNPEFTQINGLGLVLQVEATESALYVLNAGGELYRSYHTDWLEDSAWVRVCSDAKDMSASNDGVLWLDQDGQIGMDMYWSNYQLPTDWTTESGGYDWKIIPAIRVQHIAGNGSGMLLADMQGKLYYLGATGLQTVDESGNVEAVYVAGEYLVAQWSDGAVRLWDAEGNDVELN